MPNPNWLNRWALALLLLTVVAIIFLILVFVGDLR